MFIFNDINTKKSRIRRLNRLVAILYIPNPHNLPVVMHLDNNPLNNRVSNLKWGTYKENTQQMMREGRNKGQFTLKELSIEFNCKNMSRIVRRTKGEIVK